MSSRNEDAHGRPVERISRLWRRHPGGPNIFSTASSFSPPVGSHIESSVRGYYIDFRLKADDPLWPPQWLESGGRQIYVALAQWGLGCYERHLWGDGPQWLEASLAAADHLIGEQQTGGDLSGGWAHNFALHHSYRLLPPWLSAMAQGEGASLLVRAWRETGDERYAQAALRALGPMRVPVERGGVRAELEGGFFPEEYPSQPASFVLNGAIFALWGCHDVAQALQDDGARVLFEDGVSTLEQNLNRFDIGRWSRYDLFPHPVPNIASSAYHLLHINQLRAMSMIAPRPVFFETASRWEEHARSRFNGATAFARKVLFRLLVPRNQLLAHRLPWSQRQPSGDVLVLCYHGVSERWPAALAVTPAQLEDQLRYLTGRGYRGATFSEAVSHSPRSHNVVAVTFDDAYRSVFELARPILERYGVPGTVFVPTAQAGREQPMSWPGIDNWLGGPHESELIPMSWQQLRELADAGWELGSHTRTHPRLTTLDDELLATELGESRRELEQALGRPCATIAYPYGDEDPRVEAATAAAGYSEAAALPSPRLHPPAPYRWPRVGVYHDDDLKRFARKVSPAMRRMRSNPAWALVQVRHRIPALLRRGSRAATLLLFLF